MSVGGHRPWKKNGQVRKSQLNLSRETQRASRNLHILEVPLREAGPGGQIQGKIVAVSTVSCNNENPTRYGHCGPIVETASIDGGIVQLASVGLL